MMSTCNRKYQLKQLCWRCKFFSSPDKCIWVKTLKKYNPGTELDDKGYIVKCPLFEDDGLCYLTGNSYKAHMLGITRARYTRILNLIRRSPEKYNKVNVFTVRQFLIYELKTKTIRYVWRKKAKGSPFGYAKSQIKKNNIPMTEFEYIIKILFNDDQRKEFFKIYKKNVKKYI